LRQILPIHLILPLQDFATRRVFLLSFLFGVVQQQKIVYRFLRHVVFLSGVRVKVVFLTVSCRISLFCCLHLQGKILM